jgi:hypothetical protein
MQEVQPITTLYSGTYLLVGDDWVRIRTCYGCGVPIRSKVAGLVPVKCNQCYRRTELGRYERAQ